MEDVKDQLERCLERFHEGQLQAEDLERAIGVAAAAASAVGGRQSLLYVQAASSDPYSTVLGMSIYEEGADRAAIDASGEFLYPTIRQAQEDGWRIVKFPEMALLMQEQSNYGLGYEFVLERYR